MLQQFSSICYQMFIFVREVIKFTSTIFTFWDGILFSFAVCLFICWALYRKKYRISSITVTLPFSLGNITYEPTEQDRVVAWKLYTQLNTRKAALIFDEEYDVISDVYDSLYAFFPISRELLMNLPVSEIERESNIADLIFRVQNNGIRPHLTKWQADFRRWWDNALTDPGNKDRRPQDIQKGYPKYKNLTDDLKKMNLELIKFSEDLLNIAKALPKKGPASVKKPIPISPSQKAP